VIGEVHPESERFQVRLGNYGKDTLMKPQAWDAGRFTGLRWAPGESPAASQWGPLTGGGGTTVQVRGTGIGIWIDSDHPRPSVGALLPVCPGYWWWDLSRAPTPFALPDRELSFSFDLKVPTARKQSAADLYITTNFLFRDPATGQQFWLAATLFDPRGEDRFPDTVHFDSWEGGTQLPILFSALNAKSHWLHPGPGSATFSAQPFQEYRHFDVRLSAPELRRAIAAMRLAMPKLAGVGEDPAPYQLIHFNINPEVSAPPGSLGQLGLTLRDILVQVVGN
jgi:hypothetical protein